jgi:Cdc6-like AAA superfamily ATPase
MKDEISPELAHCVLAVEQGRYIAAHAEFEFWLNSMRFATIDILMSLSTKRMFGAYLAACCFVMRRPVHLHHILSERLKGDIMSYAIAFFEPAMASGASGADAATRVISFVRSLESDLVATNREAHVSVQIAPPPQPYQIQVWDSLVEDPHVQQLERELIERGLSVIKMKNYVRISNSRVKLTSIDEFKRVAEQEMQKAELLAVATAINRQACLVPTNGEAHTSVRTSAAPKLRERSPDLNAMLTELDGLIGLSAVKNTVRSLVNLVRVRHMRAEQGLPIPDVSLHMVFAGNPGTGKTTVARLIANIFAHIGVLRGGQLVEVDRSGLVAGFVGQTAIKTTEVIQRSLDGVLFIDEAYSLAERGAQDFGNEAIETLLKEMEDNRGRLIVIAAGYTARMATFIDSNPGLKSRFSRVIEFPDYTAAELLLIADHMVEQHNFLLEQDARDALGHILMERSRQGELGFGNARGVRNLLEAIMDAQANRIVNLSAPNRKDLQTIMLTDVLSAIH